jgi:hypothetical protein
MSFDTVTQLATVEIAREQFFNGFRIMYEATDFPILQDVPVHFPQCGGYSLTFPIKVGDSCLLLFCEKGYDHWLYEGNNKIGKVDEGIPKSEYFRSHNINDAVCIVGFNPITSAIPNFSSTDVELRNEDRGQRITLKPTGVIEILSQTELDITIPTVKVKASSLVEVTAPTTNIIGDVNITGKLTVSETIVATGEITGKGKVFSTHVHTGVTPGSGVTGAPQ